MTTGLFSIVLFLIFDPSRKEDEDESPQDRRPVRGGSCPPEVVPCAPGSSATGTNRCRSAPGTDGERPTKRHRIHGDDYASPRSTVCGTETGTGSARSSPVDFPGTSADTPADAPGPSTVSCHAPGPSTTTIGNMTVTITVLTLPEAFRSTIVPSEPQSSTRGTKRPLSATEPDDERPMKRRQSSEEHHAPGPSMAFSPNAFSPCEPQPSTSGTKRFFSATESDDERPTKWRRACGQEQAETSRPGPSWVDAPGPSAAAAGARVVEIDAREAFGYEEQESSEEEEEEESSEEEQEDQEDQEDQEEPEEEDEEEVGSPSPPLPPPPPRTYVHVEQCDSTSVCVTWNVGTLVVAADGTPVQAARVLHYELYVVRPRPVGWRLLAVVEPDESGGGTTMRKVRGLPAGRRLTFVVVPVDVYGRTADAGEVDVTLI